MTTDQALSLAVGETRDFEFTPQALGDMRVEIVVPDGSLRTSIGARVQDK